MAPCDAALLCSQNPGSDLAHAYVTFVRQNQEVLRDGVFQELLLQQLFEVSPP